MWTRSYTASWGDVYTHFLFWASFFLEYFFENPAQKRINLAFLSTFLSKLIPFEQFIPFLSTFLSTFLSNIQQKYFFEHFFEYSKKYSKCWVLFWVLFWELFWGFFWDFHYDKTYLIAFVQSFLKMTHTQWQITIYGRTPFLMDSIKISYSKDMNNYIFKGSIIIYFL